jgi:hypothetical protein
MLGFFDNWARGPYEKLCCSPAWGWFWERWVAALGIGAGLASLDIGKATPLESACSPASVLHLHARGRHDRRIWPRALVWPARVRDNEIVIEREPAHRPDEEGPQKSREQAYPCIAKMQDCVSRKFDYLTLQILACGAAGRRRH